MNRLILAMSLALFGCPSSTSGGDGTCTDNSGCGPGEVCNSGVCDTVCITDNDCGAGKICAASLCVTGMRANAPEITSVTGNGSAPDIFADRLTIGGLNLDGVSVQLAATLTFDLPVTMPGSTTVEVELPSALQEDTYALVVSNSAGTAQQMVQLLRGEPGDPKTGPEVLALLAPIDGTGSGLDADLLDGQEASVFATDGADILVRLAGVDGAGSGLDADTIDGIDSADLVTASGGTINSDLAIGGMLTVQSLRWSLPDVSGTAPNGLTIEPGAVVIGGAVYTNPMPKGWSFTNLVGPGGLDAGTEMSSAWYFLYAIVDATSGFTSVASLEAPPWAGGAGPTGYTDFTYIASFRNQGGDIRPFTKRGPNYEYHDQFQVLSRAAGATTTAWTSFSVGNAVPPTARLLSTSVWYDDDGVESGIQLAFRGVGSGATGHRRIASQHTTDASYEQYNSWTMLVPTDRQLDWRTHAANAETGNVQFTVQINGYEE